MKNSYARFPVSFFIALFICFVGFSSKAQHQNALDFDGIDDVVVTPLASSMIAGSSNLSMTCWVYPTNPAPSFPNFDGFCGFRNDVDADFYLVQIGASNVEARFRGSDGISRNIVFTGLILNGWNHFAFTKDASMVRLYHNGVAVDSLSSTSTITNMNEDFYSGALPYSTFFYQLTGMMDEVSLWSSTLGSDEVSCIYNGGINPADVGLQLYYNFNQGISGGANGSIITLMDFSPNMTDANLNGFAMAGTTSNFVNGTQTYTVSAITICPGEVYLFGSQSLTASGSYMEAFSAAPCDSIAQLILTVEVLSTGVTIANETLTADQTGVSYQWLDCDNAYSPIANETSQSFNPMVNGNYAVSVSTGSCTDTSACYVMTSVGIDGRSFESGFKVYPNPFDRKIEIDLRKESLSTLIEVFGIKGELVFSGSNQGVEPVKINTENWNKGIYYLKLTSGDEISVRKLMKN